MARPAANPWPGLAKARQFTPAVLRAAADVFLVDYEGCFRPLYEDAARLSKKRLSEPADEVRNAFDHLSLATRQAFMVDKRRFPMPLRPEKAKVSNRRASALTHLWQARRHLAVGRIYCLQHQINRLVDRIYQRMDQLTVQQRQAADPLMKRVDELQKKYLRAQTIRVKRNFDPEELAQDIERREAQIERLTGFVTQFGILFGQLPKPKKGRKRKTS